jgi:putative zinc finger protein
VHPRPSLFVVIRIAWMELANSMKKFTSRHRREVEISCREVVLELSDYIDEGPDPRLRRQIEQHLACCTHCTAIYDGVRNVVTLIGDDRSFELPVGFSRRLRARLKSSD